MKHQQEVYLQFEYDSILLMYEIKMRKAYNEGKQGCLLTFPSLRSREIAPLGYSMNVPLKVTKEIDICVNMQ